MGSRRDLIFHIIIREHQIRHLLSIEADPAYLVSRNFTGIIAAEHQTVMVSVFKHDPGLLIDPAVVIASIGPVEPPRLYELRHILEPVGLRILAPDDHIVRDLRKIKVTVYEPELCVLSLSIPVIYL